MATITKPVRMTDECLHAIYTYIYIYIYTMMTYIYIYKYIFREVEMICPSFQIPHVICNMILSLFKHLHIYTPHAAKLAHISRVESPRKSRYIKPAN